MQKGKSKYLSSSRKEELSELAEFVAEKYCPHNLINPQLIADKLGITYTYNDYKNSFDGLIECIDSDFHIYINTTRLNNPYTPRARFTFAHELGHYYIDEHRNNLLYGKEPPHSSFTNFSSDKYTEWEADYFASSLLIPKERLKNDCNKRVFNFSFLEELSQKYQTSLTSTAIRFSEEGNHPLLIVFCENSKIKWYWSSSDFPFKSLLHGKFQIPKDTLIGEYFQSKEIPKTTEQVWACDWFNYVGDNDANRMFYEHCVSSKNKAMSFIWEE